MKFNSRFSHAHDERWLIPCSCCSLESHLHFLSSDLTCTWWKMIDTCRYYRPESHLKLFMFRFSHDMVKDDWPPSSQVLQTRKLPRIFRLRFGLCMIIGDWLPRYCIPESHLNVFKSRFSQPMMKDDWYLQVLQIRISLKMFKFRISQNMVKDDWPLQVLQTRISPKTF